MKLVQNEILTSFIQYMMYYMMYMYIYIYLIFFSNGAISNPFRIQIVNLINKNVGLKITKYLAITV
jgi:hypothetical protein